MSSCRFTLLAPDLLRTDSPENIYLQYEGSLSSPVTVLISIQDFSKATTLLQDSVRLEPGNGYNALKTIQVTHQIMTLGAMVWINDMSMFWSKCLNLQYVLSFYNIV